MVPTDWPTHMASCTLYQSQRQQEPFWVEGFHCKDCNMGIEDEDFYAGRKVGEMTLYQLDKNYNFGVPTCIKTQ